jgi:hypothetical protein
LEVINLAEPESLVDLPTFESMFWLVAECVKHFERPATGYSDHSCHKTLTGSAFWHKHCSDDFAAVDFDVEKFRSQSISREKHLVFVRRLFHLRIMGESEST